MEHSIYHADAVLEYPQSGERIRGRSNIQITRTKQPSKKHLVVRRIAGHVDLWVTEDILTYDGKPRGALNGKRNSRLLAQLFGAAHVGISRLVKTQQAVYIARDADANAFADGADLASGCAQPKRAGSAQVQAALAEINP